MDIARHLMQPTEELLAGFRAVVVNGPRQSGKSTLVQQVQQGRGAVVTLDEPGAMEAALNDPVGFLDGQPKQVAIDEFRAAGMDCCSHSKPISIDPTTGASTCSLDRPGSCRLERSPKR